MMLENIRDILSKQLRVDRQSITMSTDIAEDLGADSLDVVEMLVTIEEELDISIPEEDVLTFKTVGDVVTYLENNQ
ncbi:MAG: acyl carrier protein [Ruminococcaceae bacterium]|nr:acyl carrier protein [Oscillospiraceae bacterium]MBO5006860.1 acyl carrier protein [Clostridia bacterium]